jgi:tetratricopeptide (TPR) repeat protein
MDVISRQQALSHSVCVLVALGALSIIASARGGPPFIVYSNATNEENQQMYGYYYYYPDVLGPDAAMKFCEKVLAEHPGNRIARKLHAEQLLRRGDSIACTDELLVLLKQAQDLWGVRDDLADAAKARGATREAAEWYREAAAVNLLPYRGASDSTKRWLKHCDLGFALELEGKLEEADNEFRGVGWATAEERDDSDFRRVLASFHMRTGKYTLAAREFQMRLEKWRGVPDYYARIDLANAQWAMGNREEALRNFQRAADESNADADRHKEPFPPTALNVMILTRLLPADDPARQKAQQSLAQSLKAHSLTHPYSVQHVVSVLSGKAELKPAVECIEEVLNKSPHLPWAISAAMYLALAEPERAGALLKRLPPGSMSRAIADVELAAQAK